MGKDGVGLLVEVALQNDVVEEVLYSREILAPARDKYVWITAACDHPAESISSAIVHNTRQARELSARLRPCTMALYTNVFEAPADV